MAYELPKVLKIWQDYPVLVRDYIRLGQDNQALTEAAAAAEARITELEAHMAEYEIFDNSEVKAAYEGAAATIPSGN
jgi:hypothetical protein